jgi:hypothetical protein
MSKLKVMTIVGTRPEIIRLSRVMAALDRHMDHAIVHTGQNYDYELNQIFFDDLEIRQPDYYLEAATMVMEAPRKLTAMPNTAATTPTMIAASIRCDVAIGLLGIDKDTPSFSVRLIHRSDSHVRGGLICGHYSQESRIPLSAGGQYTLVVHVDCSGTQRLRNPRIQPNF